MPQAWARFTAEYSLVGSEERTEWSRPSLSLATWSEEDLTTARSAEFAAEDEVLAAARAAGVAVWQEVRERRWR